MKTKIREAELFEKWTLQGLLDELDTIKLLEAPECGRVLLKSPRIMEIFMRLWESENPRYKILGIKVAHDGYAPK